MKIKIARREFLKGLSLVQGIVERKTTMPILANVLLTASGKNVSITATDLEVGVNCVYPATVEEEGRVTLHARNFYDIMRELPDDNANISVGSNNWLEITSGKSRYKIVGLSAEDFPNIPSKGEGDVWKMSADVLQQMFDKTAFAMSADETRFNLNGVYIDPAKGEGKKLLRMVATDGHRLSIMERDAGSKCGIKNGIIVPRKGVAEIKKLLDGAGGQIDMWCDSKHLIVYRDNVTTVARLIEGQFPPYEQVVPKQLKRVVSVSREGLLGALRRVSVLSSERSSGARFSVSSKNLDITTSNPDVGEAHDEVEAEYRGEAFEVGFNTRYFIDALSCIDDEKAVLEMGDETSPCVLRSETDKGFTHVIMPMRL